MSMTETADYHVSSISPSAGPIYVGSQKNGSHHQQNVKSKTVQRDSRTDKSRIGAQWRDDPEEKIRQAAPYPPTPRPRGNRIAHIDTGVDDDVC